MLVLFSFFNPYSSCPGLQTLHTTHSAAPFITNTLTTGQWVPFSLSWVSSPWLLFSIWGPKVDELLWVRVGTETSQAVS